MTPDVARTQPFAATRIGGVTSLADMAKVAAAVARAAPPPEKARLRRTTRSAALPTTIRGRSGRARAAGPAPPQVAVAVVLVLVALAVALSEEGAAPRGHLPRRPRARALKSAAAGGRGRGRAARAAARTATTRRSPVVAEPAAATTLALALARPPPPVAVPEAQGAPRQPPEAAAAAGEPLRPGAAASRYDTALPQRRGHEPPARPHRYAHAPGAARRCRGARRHQAGGIQQAKLAARGVPVSWICGPKNGSTCPAREINHDSADSDITDRQRSSAQSMLTPPRPPGSHVATASWHQSKLTASRRGPIRTSIKQARRHKPRRRRPPARRCPPAAGKPR